MNDALEAAWKDLVKTEFNVQTREENIQLISFVDGVDYGHRVLIYGANATARPCEFLILFILFKL